MNVDRMELKDIDLNLLVVFNQLLVERRVAVVKETIQIVDFCVQCLGTSGVPGGLLHQGL